MTSSDLFNRHITFFSLDTCIVQSEGYRFDQGALAKLPVVLTQPMKLILSAVVAGEIEKHRVEGVEGRANSALKALGSLSHISPELRDISESFKSIDVEGLERQRAQEEIADFVSKCGQGEILPVGSSGLLSKVFERYFSSAPPFSKVGKKKHEFPDAVALLSLEAYAERGDSSGLLISNDQDWIRYASSSARLYCLPSLDELLGLFEATTKFADEAKRDLVSELSDPRSPLGRQLENAVMLHFDQSYWNVDAVYGAFPRLEVDVDETSLHDLSVDSSSVRIWDSDEDSGQWIAKVDVSTHVDLQVKARAFFWDSTDREEFELGRVTQTVEVHEVVPVFVTVGKASLEGSPDTWTTTIDIAPSSYEVPGFEVDLSE